MNKNSTHHVSYSFHETTVYEGPAERNGDVEFGTFELAKASAIDDLQAFIDKANANLQRIKNANSALELHSE